MKTVLRIVINILYACSFLFVVEKIFEALFIANRDNSSSLIWGATERTDTLLGIGMICAPVMLVCLAAYKLNNVENSTNKRRNTILVFMPGIICCASIVYGVVRGLFLLLQVLFSWFIGLLGKFKNS